MSEMSLKRLIPFNGSLVAHKVLDQRHKNVEGNEQRQMAKKQLWEKGKSRVKTNYTISDRH